MKPIVTKFHKEPPGVVEKHHQALLVVTMRCQATRLRIFATMWLACQMALLLLHRVHVYEMRIPQESPIFSGKP